MVWVAREKFIGSRFSPEPMMSYQPTRQLCYEDVQSYLDRRCTKSPGDPFKFDRFLVKPGVWQLMAIDMSPRYKRTPRPFLFSIITVEEIDGKDIYKEPVNKNERGSQETKVDGEVLRQESLW